MAEDDGREPAPYTVDAAWHASDDPAAYTALLGVLFGGPDPEPGADAERPAS